MTKKEMFRIETYKNPVMQGVTKTQEGFLFTVRIPDAKEASLLLYRQGSDVIEQEILLPVRDRIGEIASVCVEPLETGAWEYNYRIDQKVVTDPYAVRICGRDTFGMPVPQQEDAHKMRGGLPDGRTAQTASLEIPYEDTILYKAHVRGFTKDSGSGVRQKGTFAGVAEKIPYLKSLGITSLELMPVYEFMELPAPETQRNSYTLDLKKEPKVNYWGYGPAFYFAPKAAYAAGEDPVAEFAELVDALHREGLECILEFYFPGDARAGFVLDVLHYWLLTFHVDGFHLVGEGSWLQQVVEDPLLKRSKLIAIGYDMGAFPKEHQIPTYKNLGEHNLAFLQIARRFLKGDEGCAEEIAYRMRRNPQTSAVINYFADHDGYTMADMVAYEQKHNEENGEQNQDGSNHNFTWNCGVEGPSRKKTVRQLRERQMRNAWMILLLSQGTPMIYAGDEICNSTGGNNNPYCQDNEVGWLSWNKNKNHRQMLEFVRNAIGFRKAHPILHLAGEPRLMDYRSYGIPDLSYHGERAWYGQMEYNSRCFGAMYCGAYAVRPDGTLDNCLYLAYNMHWEEHELALPKVPDGLCWKIAADTSQEFGFFHPGEEPGLANQRKLAVPPRTVMVLIAGEEE